MKLLVQSTREGSGVSIGEFFDGREEEEAAAAGGLLAELDAKDDVGLAAIGVVADEFVGEEGGGREFHNARDFRPWGERVLVKSPPTR
jgi:hypothetical protein